MHHAMKSKKLLPLLWLALALPVSILAQGFGTIYTEAQLDEWQRRYTASTQKMLDIAFKPVFTADETRRFRNVRLNMPKTDPADPFAFYTNGQSITISAQTMMFLWDICLAYAWLYSNDYSLETITDYVAMLKYKKPGSFSGKKYPPPLKALGIPANAGDDKAVFDLSLSFFNSARACILAHEFGHIYYRHPGNSQVAEAVSRANEDQADQYALEVLSRFPEIPMGGLLVHQLHAHYDWDDKNATHPTSASRITRMANYLEKNARAFGNDPATGKFDPKNVQTALGIAQGFRSLGLKLADPDLHAGIRVAAENATVQSLQPRKISIEKPAPPTQPGRAFVGEYTGAYIRFMPGNQSERLDVQVSLYLQGGKIRGNFNFRLGYGTITQGLIEGKKLSFRWNWGRYQGYGRLEDKGSGKLKGTWGYSNDSDGAGEWDLRKQ